MADEVKHAARAALPGDPPRACTCSNPEHCAALHALHECTLSCTKVVVIIVLSIARLSTESASLYPFGPSNLGAADATPRLTKPPCGGLLSLPHTREHHRDTHDTLERYATRRDETRRLGRDSSLDGNLSREHRVAARRVNPIMRSHPDVNCTSDSRRRGREGRLYLGAVAVDGQATAGKMSIAIRDLARAAAGP